MSSDNLALFSDRKYANLETYKKSGEPVKTTIWFVISKGILYITTPSGTGKIKRLRHTDKVRLAPSDFKGDIKGPWVTGKAYFADESESKEALYLRKKKYGFMVSLVSIFSKRVGKPLVIGVKLD